MRRLFILAWLIILGVTQVQAAEPSQEMILLRRENPAVWSWRYGNLYTYALDGEAPKPLTTLGNITAPALSPDGKTIAYASLPESIMPKIAQGQYTSHPDHDDPLDIWLMDRDSKQFQQIASQPTDKSIYRSSPLWSPNSQQLAWFTWDVSWDSTVDNGSVEIYDRTTGTSKVVATGLMMNRNDVGLFNLPNLVGWGAQIAHEVITVNGTDRSMLLETIDPSGIVDRQIIAHTDYLPRIMWVKHQDSWWVATQTMEDKWQLIQPKTGEQIDLTEAPILQLPDDEGVKVKPDSTAWQILTENGETVSIPYEGPVAIAPDGKAVIHLRERKAYLWREGQELAPLLADWEIITVLWTPMVWVS